MKKFYLLFSLTLYFLGSVTFAQKPKNVQGSAQVRMEVSMTEFDAYKLAEEYAKIEALQNTFGTIADQEFNMMIREGKTDYNIIAKTEVRGEWVETIDRDFEENLKEEKTDEGIRYAKWITCHIKGKARKLPLRALIDFYPLNGPDLLNRTTEFTDGASLFLHFRSPVDGYLSVYIDDGSITSRLLPDTYTSSKFESAVFVIGDKDYIFFSPKQNNLSQEKVEEYLLFTTQKVEYNYLYIIFSENPFIKPFLEDKQTIEENTLPKSLRSDKFQNWLTENRYADASFQARQMAITIVAN